MRNPISYFENVERVVPAQVQVIPVLQGIKISTSTRKINHKTNDLWKLNKKRGR